MILSIHLYRFDLSKYEEEYISEEFDFGIDEISSNWVSEFELNKFVQIEKGDYLLAKDFESGRILYFGVIDSQEDIKIRCRDLAQALGDSSFPTCKTTGPSFEGHFKRLIEKYLLSDSTKNLSGILTVVTATNTNHSYQATEVTSRKLNSYLRNAFKKYNIKWTFEEIKDGKIFSTIKRIDTKKQIKDNSSEFFDWNIFIKKPGNGNENMLLIVDKKMSDIENPRILSTYYLDDQNELTTDKTNVGIIKPTVSIVSIYDTEQEDKATYEEVANSELKGNAYSHEINVSIILDSKNFDIRDLQTGLLFDVTVKEKLYKSVLSAWKISSSSRSIKLTFGNIRSRVSDYFDEN
ncbi:MULTISPECIES: hypothetical protein [Enterococcus]|uniref:hypothetical protein n=1 Tax=Enterococcus TaxID=1350 RepID=UPI000EC18703|nr:MULTISPECIES: hypothetical protein [Enterococcus]HCM87945.1 hypothetical protein [Enterococcus sp.]